MSTVVPDQAVRVLKQFRVIFRAVKEHYRKVEQLTGLSGSHVWALVVIDENPGIRPGALNDRLAIHQSTASNIVRHLVAQGYVLRTRSQSDARAFELAATAKGHELLGRACMTLYRDQRNCQNHLFCGKWRVLCDTIGSMDPTYRQQYMWSYL